MMFPDDMNKPPKAPPPPEPVKVEPQQGGTTGMSQEQMTLEIMKSMKNIEAMFQRFLQLLGGS